MYYINIEICTSNKEFGHPMFFFLLVAEGLLLFKEHKCLYYFVILYQRAYCRKALYYPLQLPIG